MIVKRLFLLIVGLPLIAGCSHKMTIAPTVKPTVVLARPHQGTVGVFISSDLRTVIVKGTPSSIGIFGSPTYEYEIGQALSMALQRSVRVAYKHTTIVDTLPSPREFEHVFGLSCGASKLDIEIEEGMPATYTCKVHCALEVLLEFYSGGSMALKQRIPITGRSQLSEGIGSLRVEDVCARTIEAAIQDVSNQVAGTLISHAESNSRRLSRDR